MTLLEIVVALVILSASFAVLMNLFSISSRNANGLDYYRGAITVAENLLAQLPPNLMHEPLRQSGFAGDRYQWEVIHAPFDGMQVDDLQSRRVSVRVTWNRHGSDEREFRMSTVRLNRRWQ